MTFQDAEIDRKECWLAALVGWRSSYTHALLADHFAMLPTVYLIRNLYSKPT